MPIAKVLEVIAEGDTVESAVQNAVNEVSKTVRNVNHVYVEGFKALVENGKVVSYRVNAKVTFIVD